MTYQLLASGDGKKREQFGEFIIDRPCGQAIWNFPKRMEKADASFSREEGKGWSGKALPKEWTAELSGILMRIQKTDFGHLGAFPEHSTQADFLKKHAKGRVLNLFAYSGWATLFLAKHGVEVTHLDASKGMVDWARQNAVLNGLKDKPIRWIVEDAIKYLKREAKRGSFYDGVILDPPSFGRGAQGQVFKIERDIGTLLELVKEVLVEDPSFVLFTCHTPGMTPICLEHLMNDLFPDGSKESGEMCIEGEDRSLPTGSFVRWVN